jgi:hypothetical protein
VLEGVAGAGLKDLEFELVIALVRELSRGGGEIGETPPSPSRTKVSMAFSMFPFTPFRTMVLRFSSVNPMSRNCASFSAARSLLSWPKLAPKTFEGLLRSSPIGLRGGVSRGLWKSSLWCCGLFLDRNDRGNPEGLDLFDFVKNRLPVLGGSGGGVPSSEIVLPVRCSLVPPLLVVVVVLVAVVSDDTYFERMKRSMAESASSASTGTGGCLFCAL